MSKKTRVRLSEKWANYFGFSIKEEKTKRNPRYSLTPDQLEEYHDKTGLKANSSGREKEELVKAWHPKESRIMSITEFCLYHEIPINSIDSAKLVTSTSKDPYYNILFKDIFRKIEREEYENDLIKNITKDVKPYKKQVSKSNNEIALQLYISDTHIGAETKKDSIYSNDYNKEVFANRMTKVTDLCRRKRELLGVLDTLFISNLGDSLDGFNGLTTRGGHKLPQNMDNKEAFNCYVKEYKRMLETVVSENIAQNYVIHFVADDNHSGDFGWMAARAIQEYCLVRFPFMKVILQDKFLDVYKYGIHNFILTHGKDKQEMKHGMPKLLDTKTELKIKDYINYHNIEGEISVIKGDLHQDSVDFCNMFRYRNVLSLYGASKWIHLNFGWSRCGVSYDVVPKNSVDIEEGRLFM